MGSSSDEEALAWQTGVWDNMSDVYLTEVDQRFIPVIDGVIRPRHVAHSCAEGG
jgi:hypothetical protein